MKVAPAGILVLVIVLAATISGCSRTSPTPQSWFEQSSERTRDQPCGARFSGEVEQIFANPQTFAHRIVTIPGQYLSGFETSLLFTCANGHIVDLWVENAWGVLAMAKMNEQLPLAERWDNPILKFKFDEQKNAAAWGKLNSQGYSSDVTLVGQVETKTSDTGGFGHLGAHKHELILLDVLSSKTCDSTGLSPSLSSVKGEQTTQLV
jgi:hypothetical protein